MSNLYEKLPCADVLLSIITVSYNDAARLSKTIQSLLPFYGDARYEHIVVDGGSTDQTVNVVGPLRSTHNFRFDSELDSGIYDAMNRGAQKSSGKFQLFLNCGDCMLATPDELTLWLRELDHESVSIACFSFRQVDTDCYRMIIPEKVRRNKLPTSHQGMVFSSRFVQEHFYDTCYKIAADYDLYLHAKPSQIIIAPMNSPLTSVEVHGVASGNPVTSYKEYLLIAFRNLYGIELLVCFFRIACRAMVIIPIKLLFPYRWIKRLRFKS